MIPTNGRNHPIPTTGQAPSMMSPTGNALMTLALPRLKALASVEPYALALPR